MSVTTRREVVRIVAVYLGWQDDRELIFNVDVVLGGDLRDVNTEDASKFPEMNSELREVRMLPSLLQELTTRGPHGFQRLRKLALRVEFSKLLREESADVEDRVDAVSSGLYSTRLSSRNETTSRAIPASPFLYSHETPPIGVPNPVSLRTTCLNFTAPPSRVRGLRLQATRKSLPPRSDCQRSVLARRVRSGTVGHCRFEVAAAPLFDSVLQDLAVIGVISTFAFVLALFRFKRAEVVPAWWWLATAAVLAIVGFGGSGISAGRALAIILSGAALGIGVQRLFELWRSGRLRFRTPQPLTVGE